MFTRGGFAWVADKVRWVDPFCPYDGEHKTHSRLMCDYDRTGTPNVIHLYMYQATDSLATRDDRIEGGDHSCRTAGPTDRGRGYVCNGQGHALFL